MQAYFFSPPSHSCLHCCHINRDMIFFLSPKPHNVKAHLPQVLLVWSHFLPWKLWPLIEKRREGVRLGGGKVHIVLMSEYMTQDAIVAYIFRLTCNIRSRSPSFSRDYTSSTCSKKGAEPLVPLLVHHVILKESKVSL